MTEIWVPYGPVEVSFDIKQENLSQILEPQPAKMTQESLERTVDAVSEDTILQLSGTPGTQKVLDLLLTRNKGVRKILHPKNIGALARRKAQEFGIEAEPLNLESLVEIGLVDATPARIPAQLRSGKILVVTSVHQDPLFGLTSAASDLVSLLPELMQQAFRRSLDDLPCNAKSNASWYAIRALQTCPVNVLEIIEKTTTGVLSISHGEPEKAHEETLNSWTGNFSVTPPGKSERIIFGSGGQENDRTLSAALARAFFPVATTVAQEDSESRICMLAECSQGLGSEALLRFVTGRFDPRSKLDSVAYFDGLEVLLSFYRVQRDLQLTILTTLPKFYASKLEFKTIGGAREAPSSIVQQGSRAKILVVTDASTSYFPT
jgi:hypothetical protein